MKKAFAFLGILFMLVGCNHRITIDIEGRLVDSGASMIYMVVENTSADTLASASVNADNTFHLVSKITQPTTAFLCDDNGNALTMFLTEDTPLTLRPAEGGGYVVEGGPINDKYNLTMRQLSDLARQIMNIDQNSETAEEEYESLMAKYHDAIATSITYNLDNIIGVELFIHQESRNMTAEDMHVRFAQFSEQMQNLPQMRQFKEYIEVLQRSQVGEPFIDATTQTITGTEVKLSDICGKGKWVLLDFWASWCAPCVQEIPMLKAAYESYALMGFEICAISLDPDIDRLREFVAEEQLLWHNLLDQPSEDALPVSEQYGVQYIPTNFLISPDGKIVAHDLHGEQLLHELQHFIEGEEFCTFPQLHNNQHDNERDEK